MIWYAITIFWSAFLLFLVQPMLGKQILPWFGGTPAVWTTCLLFFQVLLLGGYLYAHGLTAWLKPRAQAVVHLAVLAASLWFLPIATDPAYRARVEGSPTWQILALLTFTVGAPYFILSTTGPLLQSWFAHTHERSPYRLYALSNVGSLLALLSYPFVVEPRLKLGEQTGSWSWAYGLFGLACALCAVQLLLMGKRDAATADGGLPSGTPSPTPAATADVTAPHDDPRPGPGTMALWLGLATCASAMLLATTNQMCQEVAVVPFLWILPLTLYLLSFIICFDSPRWYVRSVFLSLLAVSAVLATVILFVGVDISEATQYIGIDAPIFSQVFIYALTLFACAMACHGELVRSKPHARHLTLFYLLISIGGALGGVFVALVAPRIFNGYWEYHLALLGSCILVIAALVRDPATRHHFIDRGRVTGLAAALTLVVAGLATALGIHARTYFKNNLVAVSRNFYGLLRVYDEEMNVGDKDHPRMEPVRKLAHGIITHGTQFLDAERRRIPVSYYSPDSGIALAIGRYPRHPTTSSEQEGIKIGVIGLGAGTVAAFGREGDTVRFYEINPVVVEMAQRHFTYLSDTPATVEIAEGDARLVLENELAMGQSQQFDILVMDAFSSDAIPMHLVTKECVAMYLKHLKPGGILLVNISNRNVDLQPLVLGLAKEFGKQAFYVDASGDDPKRRRAGRGYYPSSWAIITSNEEFLKDEQVQAAFASDGSSRGAARHFGRDVKPILWTDDYGSLWQVLK
ncbi:MAG: fused MFS/spermidine synthase [Planctomycetia bacterium]|nr:fused MFS/spermidine synthase [Planctomycetia bacterium]